MHSPQQTARLAGFTYLSLGILTFFGYLCGPLVLGDDPAALARQLSVSALRFRLGIFCDLSSQVLNVFLVMLLYQLLKPVNQRHAALMAVLFLVSMPVSFVITIGDMAARALLVGGDSLSAFTGAQREALAMLVLRLHIHGVYAVEAFWGLWLLPLGLLVFRSRFIPRILGILQIVAGLTYTAHSVASLLLPRQLSAAFETAAMIGRVGELPIILWLLIRGVSDQPPPNETLGRAAA